jgi:hypothetical protein
MKQTAVEWLLDQLENQVSDDGKQTMSLKVTGFLREQAKEIEKQQIIDAYWEGSSNWDNETEAEQYYNEQFKNK